MAEHASSQELTRLKAVLDGALAGLENVVPKRLFGCDGWFVGGSIFALVWKDGRVGLRLSDPALLAEALALEGAGPWLQDGKAVKHWALLPAAWSQQPARLRAWGRKAFALARDKKQVKGAVFKRLDKDGRER